jgi:phage-related protein
MAFREELNIDIQTRLDSDGFKRLRKELGKTEAQMAGSMGFLRQVQEFNQLRASVNKLDNALAEANLDVSFEEGGSKVRGADGKFKDKQEVLAQTAAALRRLRNGTPINISFGEMRSPADMLKDDFDPSRFEIPSPTVSDNLTPEPRNLNTLNDGLSNSFDTAKLVEGTPLSELSAGAQEAVRSISDVTTGLDEVSSASQGINVQTVENLDRSRLETANMKFQRLARSIPVFRTALDRAAPATQSMAGLTKKLGGSLGRAGRGMSNTARMTGALTRELGRAAPSAQKLQMRLLGLQFTLLTLAFVFGGLAAGALGAVGVFEVLGNTLRFFFLPSALNVLDIVLDFQEFIMGLDESVRESIGNFLLAAAAVAAFGSLLTILASPIVTIISVLTTVGGALSSFLTLLAGILQTGVLGVLSMIGSLIGGIAVGFKLVTSIAARFGKKVAAVAGTIIAVIAGIGAVIASGVLLPLALAGAAIGALLGIIFVFRDKIISIVSSIVSKGVSIFMGLLKGLLNIGKQIFKGVVGFFGKLAKAIVGNSIIPDMVANIVSFIMSIPGKIAGIGQSIVATIVNGLTSVGSSIFEAFKGILPDFVVDALIGAGSAVKNIGSGIAKAGSNLISGVSNTVGGIPGGGNGGSGGNNNVQQNNINVQAEVNNSEETAGETGRQVGQAIGNETNRRNRFFN